MKTILISARHIDHNESERHLNDSTWAEIIEARLCPARATKLEKYSQSILLLDTGEDLYDSTLNWLFRFVSQWQSIAEVEELDFQIAWQVKDRISILIESGEPL